MNLLWVDSIFDSIQSLVYDTNQAAFEIHTLSVMGNFGIGALVALAAYKKHPIFNWLVFSPARLQHNLIFLIPILLITYPLWQNIKILSILSRVVFALLFGIYIINQAFSSNPIITPGNSKLLTYSGKISCGLYVYHGIVITFLSIAIQKISIPENIFVVVILYPFIILASSFLIAHISYQFFERKFLNLKQYFYD